MAGPPLAWLPCRLKGRPGTWTGDFARIIPHSTCSSISAEFVSSCSWATMRLFSSTLKHCCYRRSQAPEMGGAIFLITIDKEGASYGPRVQAFQCHSSPQGFAWRCGFGPRFIVSRLAGVYQGTAGAPVAETTCPAIPKPRISILARPQMVFLRAQSNSRSIASER